MRTRRLLLTALLSLLLCGMRDPFNRCPALFVEDVAARRRIERLESLVSASFRCSLHAAGALLEPGTPDRPPAARLFRGASGPIIGRRRNAWITEHFCFRVPGRVQQRLDVTAGGKDELDIP